MAGRDGVHNMTDPGEETMADADMESLQEELRLFREEKEKIRGIVGQIGGTGSRRRNRILAVSGCSTLRSGNGPLVAGDVFSGTGSVAGIRQDHMEGARNLSTSPLHTG